MKISEVVTGAEQQRVNTLKTTADAAKKRAKVAAATLQVNKAQQKLKQAQAPVSAAKNL